MNLYLCSTAKNPDKPGSIAYGVVRAKDSFRGAQLFKEAIKDGMHEEDINYVYIEVRLIYDVEGTEEKALQVEDGLAHSYHRETL